MNRIDAQDLTPGMVFHTSNSDTLYVCQGYPHISGGRVRVTYHVLDKPEIHAEFICYGLSSMFVAG